MRLTEKDLPELNKIQDELGIDLITLYKAMKNGVWLKESDGIKHHEVRGIEKHCLSCIDSICCYAECDCPAYYVNYGKTWALTKEELI